ncbi:MULTISPECIES: transposase [Catenulispora]|uniref:transposase n=1 Tax=Catenulispora TaxID=414878 RepID=UPI001E4F64C5|nr:MULTISPECIES: transposase [Catenulispora]
MGRRDPVTMISAIEQRGRIHFNCFTGTFDKTTFIEFCEQLLADDGGTVFLIVDGAPSHRAKDVKTFVENAHGRLRLFFLPGYSPTLNPDEWVWNSVKAARAGRRAVQAPGQLYAIAVEALQRLAATPEIVRGFFRDPDLAYLN